MANKCNQCGTLYDGWSCPVCSAKEEAKKQKKEAEKQKKEVEKQTKDIEHSLQDQQRAMERAVEEQQTDLERQKEYLTSELEDARLDMEYELKESDARHRKTTSESWKLQADAKVDRACDLFGAGLYEEAEKLGVEAIAQDPGNIWAYRIASRACYALGDYDNFVKLLDKQLFLLKTSEYRHSASEALRVTEDIFVKIDKDKDHDQVITTLLDILYNNSKEWSIADDDIIELLNTLANRSFLDEAKLLFRNILEYTKRNKLTSSYPPALKYHAYIIEAKHLLNIHDADNLLSNFLRRIQYDDRMAFFLHVKTIMNSNTISQNTKKTIKTEILKRYEEWRVDIKRKIDKDAAETAKIEADWKKQPSRVGWIVGIGGFVFLCILLAKSDLGTGFMLGSLIVLALPIAAGVFTFRFIRSNLEDHIKDELITSMANKENEKEREYLDTLP